MFMHYFYSNSQISKKLELVMSPVSAMLLLLSHFSHVRLCATP